MASSSDASPHLLVRTIAPPTAVRFVERGCFRAPKTCDLLLGRGAALTLLHETADGELETVCEQHLFGTLHDMQIVDRSSEQVRPLLRRPLR